MKEPIIIMWLNYLFVLIDSFICTVAREYGKRPLDTLAVRS
jgi:hypothetical protein